VSSLSISSPLTPISIKPILAKP
jgi:hypothetical protein